MKKSLLIACTFVFCSILIAGSFSGLASAKGAKKETAKAEKTVVETTVVEKTVVETTTKKATTSSNTKTSTTSKKINTAASSETERLFKAKGTSQAEIKALIEQYSGANLVSSAPATGEQINWQVISGGGGSGSSTNFGLISVIGQTAVGVGTSANFGLNHGFLQSFAPQGCCVAAGDYNNDGSFNIADVTAGIARIFTGGGAPSCQDQADFNSDGGFNIADVTAGIARIFTGGGPPICGTTGS